MCNSPKHFLSSMLSCIFNRFSFPTLIIILYYSIDILLSLLLLVLTEQIFCSPHVTRLLPQNFSPSYFPVFAISRKVYNLQGRTLRSRVEGTVRLGVSISNPEFRLQLLDRQYREILKDFESTLSLEPLHRSC